ncbi:hypothetical protein [Nocardioides sp.]|jgi:hypothetical protein|uniref:hypothetical protein n=1 Tax=Nocardioides sp. TaxID=35761 RepID=UPI0035B1D5E0
MWRTLSRTWGNRVFLALAASVAVYLYTGWLDWDPQPVPFAVMMAVVLTLVWMVYDILDDEPAHWVPSLPPVGDRVDQATSDLRILSSHVQASVPTEAVRERLVALARGRDPDLADALRRELGGPHDPARRLSPAEIDRILTRIEDARDHR